MRDVTFKTTRDQAMTMEHCSVVSDVGHLASEADLTLEAVLDDIADAVQEGRDSRQITDDIRERYSSQLEAEPDG